MISFAPQAIKRKNHLPPTSTEAKFFQILDSADEKIPKYHHIV